MKRSSAECSSDCSIAMWVRRLREEFGRRISSIKEINVKSNEFENVFPVSMRAALRMVMKVKRPTPIQTEAIPIAGKGQNLLCSAATGTGKTLCYLVPIYQN